MTVHGGGEKGEMKIIFFFSMRNSLFLNHFFFGGGAGSKLSLLCSLFLFF